MASFKLGPYLLIVSVFAFHLLPSPVVCDAEKKKNLLHDINVYRKILNLPDLEKSSKASCVASKIADDLEDKHCEDFRDYYPAPGTNPKIPTFQDSVRKCMININTTKDGVVMPVCVPNLEPDALFSNYTKPNRYTKYLNNSKYTIAGIASEDDWMVLIISTNTSSGDFSSANSLLVEGWKTHSFVFALFSTALIFLIS
ncbi:uncharacterized GPI-anchored protein At3g06035-like isoform X2 [Abrus precatorius]|uniref:Uncharacterized GPI-anchored protein At3g06035-like isoform X2 n=1 Tax=Abrus precatorius TaxID=3816 RepID=A0A8B8MG71_ABRPR|nr:uncharacterized GPI-anchored protein At3g06035-like isoform X2 [Abrus precatorius]